MKKYIVLEGIHGCGKSSVGHALVARLQSQGHNAQYYHMPDEDDMLGKVIRQTVADRTLAHHWQVTGLLYAAFANRFHYQTQDDDVIYVLDRHSVTSGLLFQKDISDVTRQDIYGPGIDALQRQGIVFYVALDKEIAKARRDARDAELMKQGGVWADKANDTFIEEKFDQLADMYDNYLIEKVRALDIPMHTVHNNTTVEDCVEGIVKFL